MKKRILSMFLTVCIFATMLSSNPITIFAETVASGTCGVNLTWVLDSDGTFTVSGSGNMRSDANAPWYDVRNSIKKVVIENGVTRISDWAFYDCANLTDVTIPDRDCDTIGLNQ